MSAPPQIPDRWTPTEWRVRYGAYELQVSRKWVKFSGSFGHRPPDELRVSWSLGSLGDPWKKTVEGDFKSSSTLFDDLKRAENEARMALLSRSRDFREISEAIDVAIKAANAG